MLGIISHKLRSRCPCRLQVIIKDNVVPFQHLCPLTLHVRMVSCFILIQDALSPYFQLSQIVCCLDIFLLNRMRLSLCLFRLRLFALDNQFNLFRRVCLFNLTLGDAILNAS